MVQHGKVGGVLPVGFFTQVMLHTLVEFRPRQRIANADTDVIGQAITHHLDSFLDVLPRFARIAELEEEGGANVVSFEFGAGGIDLLDPCAFVHGV